MITRKKITTAFLLSSGYYSLLVLAQDFSESSGDNDDFFMQADGQEEFIEYRLENDVAQRELNGGDDASDDFYIDYSPVKKIVIE